MELIERINGLEGELKLVKTEIKKVLIDLRELMNNYENPFVNIENLKGAVREPKKEVREERNTRIKEELPNEKEEEEEEEPVYKAELESESEEDEEEDEEEEPEPGVNKVSSVRVRGGESGKKKKLAKLKKITGSGTGKIDIFTLTQLMKWADNSLATIGKEKLNEIIDLYELTGRLPKEIKDVIFKIEELSTVNSVDKEQIEMKDCILAIFQLDRIVTGETGAQAPLMLSEDDLERWLKVR